MYYRTLYYKEKESEPEYIKKKMVFTKPDSDDFFPKTKLVCGVDEQDMNFFGDRFDPQFTNEDQETMEAFAKICKRLTKEELLEVLILQYFWKSLIFLRQEKTQTISLSNLNIGSANNFLRLNYGMMLQDLRVFLSILFF